MIGGMWSSGQQLGLGREFDGVGGDLLEVSLLWWERLVDLRVRVEKVGEV